MSSIKEAARQMKRTAPEMASASLNKRNQALWNIAEALEAEKQEIFAANREDLEAAKRENLAEAVQKRLKYDEAKMRDSIAGLRQLEGLADPVGRQLMARQLDEGLDLYRVSVPIGVIGVIFEARPDAMVQVASLCIKSGNCAVLKGGKETARTNRVLFSLIKNAVLKAGLPEGCLFQAEGHSEIDELLSCDEEVDLLIPRGSNRFVRYIMEHTRIPVMGHSSGICHIYVDEKVDQEQAIPIIVDAKTQYPAACNAVETLLVHRGIAEEFLPRAAEALAKAGVRLRGTKEAADLLECLGKGAAASKQGDLCDLAKERTEAGVCGEGRAAARIAADDVMQETDFGTEYGDLTLSVKLVGGVEEAAEHINQYGSHHTDAILTTDDEAAEYFLQRVDSAGVYRNCSTRFADGFRYGFGAEVGISTGKLHARGPVGLEGLVTYKYRLYGHGQIVSDYVLGRKSFCHKEVSDAPDSCGNRQGRNR